MQNGSGGAHLGMLGGLWRRGWQGEVLQGWIGPNPGKSRLIQPFAGFLWGARQRCAGSFASFGFAGGATSADRGDAATLSAALFVPVGRWGGLVVHEHAHAAITADVEHKRSTTTGKTMGLELNAGTQRGGATQKAFANAEIAKTRLAPFLDDRPYLDIRQHLPPHLPWEARRSGERETLAPVHEFSFMFFVFFCGHKFRNE